MPMAVYVKNVRSRISPPIFLFFSSYLLTGVARWTIAPILPIYVRDLGFSIADLGIVSAGSGLALMIFEPICGLWADKVGAKGIFIFSALLMPLIVFSFTLSGDFAVFAALMFFSGLSLGAGGVSSRMLARMGGWKGGRAFGAWYAAFSAAGVIGPAIGGFTATIDYRLAFYVAAVIGIVAFFLSLGTSGTDNAHLLDKGHETRGLDREEKRLVIAVSSLMILPMFLISVHRTFLPVFAKEKFLLSPSEISSLFTIIGVVGLFAPLIFSEFSDRIGMRRMIMLGMALQASSFLLLPVASGIMMLVLAAFILGLGNAATSPLTMALLMEKISASKQGLVLGVYGFCENVGITLGPLIVGFIYQNYGAEFSFYATSGLMLVNLIFCIILLSMFVIRKL